MRYEGISILAIVGNGRQPLVSLPNLALVSIAAWIVCAKRMYAVSDLLKLMFSGSPSPVRLPEKWAVCVLS